MLEELSRTRVEIIQKLEKLSKWYVLLIGVLIGSLLLATYRFISYSPENVHYHANFAIYVNGGQEMFNGAGFYEEVTICNSEDGVSPEERVHMHMPENSVVHIHADAVTWGHFFENLGFSVGPNHLSTGIRTYSKEANDQVRYVLNGEVKRNAASQQIGDTDRLLVLVDDMSDEQAKELFNEIVPDNAEEFNNRKDPGTCSSGENEGLNKRFKNIF